MSDKIENKADLAYFIADLVTIAIGEVSYSRRLLSPEHTLYNSLQRAESALCRLREPLQELIIAAIASNEGYLSSQRGHAKANKPANVDCKPAKAARITTHRHA